MQLDGFKLYSVRWSDSQTRSHKVLAFLTNVLSKHQVCVAYLLVFLEGNVPADHVEQEDSQGPHGGAAAVVLTVADPLWGRIDSGPWNYIYIKLQTRLSVVK